MKKIIFQSFACLLMITAISCSTDNDAGSDNVLYNESANAAPAKEGSIWDGKIGEVRGDTYIVTADKEAILAYFENDLQKFGITADLTSLAIVEKVAVNDPSDRGYFLLATGSPNVSMGMMIQRESNNTFVLNRSNGLKSTACQGCATGCNLEYYHVNGKRVPYCNENGCVYDCDKIEIEMP